MIEYILTMTMAAKVSTAAPRGKVTDWIRWRVKHKTTWFLYWLILSNLFQTCCCFCLRGDILNLDEGGEGVEALPLSHLVHCLILLLLKMSGQCHHISSAVYPQLQYQRVVVGVVVVVVQFVIIQLVSMAKTQLVTIGGRSCWVIADTSIRGCLELDIQF